MPTGRRTGSDRLCLRSRRRRAYSDGGLQGRPPAGPPRRLTNHGRARSAGVVIGRGVDRVHRPGRARRVGSLAHRADASGSPPSRDQRRASRAGAVGSDLRRTVGERILGGDTVTASRLDPRPARRSRWRGRFGTSRDPALVHFDLSRDGRLVVFSREELRGDIWIPRCQLDTVLECVGDRAESPVARRTFTGSSDLRRTRRVQTRVTICQRPLEPLALSSSGCERREPWLRRCSKSPR